MCVPGRSVPHARAKRILSSGDFMFSCPIPFSCFLPHTGPEAPVLLPNPVLMSPPPPRPALLWEIPWAPLQQAARLLLAHLG